MTARLGVDVGGTVTRVVLLDDAGDVAASHRRATCGDTFSALVDSISAAVGETLSARGVSGSEAGSLGLGIPGRVDVAHGTVSHVANLELPADRLPLAAALEDSLGIPTVLDNDVNVAALGALRLVAPPGCRSLVYLSIGTGISAGIVIDGDVWRGDGGFAGEIGHLQVERGGAACSCGRRGCLETVASGRAISRQWAEAGAQAPAVSLFAAAFSGNREAIRLRDRVVGCWARTIEGLALTLDPRWVVVGGGVAEVGGPLLDALRAELAAPAGSSPFYDGLGLPGRLLLAPPGALVGAVGAALLVAPRGAARRDR